MQQYTWRYFTLIPGKSQNIQTAMKPRAEPCSLVTGANSRYDHNAETADAPAPKPQRGRVDENPQPKAHPFSLTPILNLSKPGEKRKTALRPPAVKGSSLPSPQLVHNWDIETDQAQRSQRWHQGAQPAWGVCKKLVGAALDCSVGAAGGFRAVDARAQLCPPGSGAVD